MKAHKYILAVVWICLVVTLFIGMTSAHSVNTNLEFSITSNFATSCNLTTINNPAGIIEIGQNVLGSGTFNFNILGGNYSLIGSYCHNIICTDGTQTTSGKECFDISTSGESFDISQFGVIFAFAIMLILFMALGFSFSTEKWKLRGFFFVLAMFFGLLMLNSIRVLAGISSTMDSMVTSGMIIGVIAVSFMAIYLLIMYTIELFKTIKNKRSLKWTVSEKFN